MIFFVFIITMLFSYLVFICSNAELIVTSIYIFEVIAMTSIAWWIRCSAGSKWLVIYLLCVIAIFDFISSLLITKREFFDGWYAIYPVMLGFGVVVNQMFYWVSNRFFSNRKRRE